MNICTIIARNYAAHARVLARSFAEAHPDGRCSVLVVDEADGFLDPAHEPFEVIRLDQIGLPDPERMAAYYNVIELSTAVKPWLMRHLLDRDGIEAVTYLDPDIRIEDSLGEVDDLAVEHGAVLTPHLTSPLPRDGRKPSERDIMVAGSYNLGFIALGAEGGIADPLLDWWSERLADECLVDPVNGLFVDQRWIDLAPGIWPGMSILRKPGYNVAYWNLPQRRFEIAGDGYQVDGEPLRFFHFSGYDPRRAHELSKYQNRIALRTNEALSRICDEYGAELREQGFAEASAWSYGWGETGDGVTLDELTRELYREGIESGRFRGSVFAVEDAARFTEYLSASVYDGTAPISRYAKALWESRSDLRKAYPDLDGGSAGAYVEWIRRFGDETGLRTELLLGANRVEEAEAEEATAGAPDPGRSGSDASTIGVNVVGYLSSERGVGEAARQVISALRSRSIPVAEIDSPAEPSEIAKVLSTLASVDHPHDFNLLCVNADMLPTIAAALGSHFFDRHRSAGLWFWEVSDFPQQWHEAFKNLDEVWVASEFIAEALRPVSPIPVRTMRVPVTPVEPAELGRGKLGMPDGFTFLFVFDYRSVFSRKNPLGLVEAFRRAFEPGEGPSLAIKSIFAEQFPRQHDELVAAVADRPEIHLLEDNVPAATKNAMVASCDCYVSLHRSEGLGLTMAEAMYFGRPVIATAYSGNLDFMTAANSYLVPYRPTNIGPDASPYPADGEWADPDLDQAAALMRAAYRDPTAAARRGAQAAADIRLTHSPEAAAAWIEARLSEGRAEGTIARLRAAGPSGSALSPKGELEHLLGFGGAPPEGDDGGMLGASTQRARTRLIKPYADHQHHINETTARALDELRAELADLRDTLATVLEDDLHAPGRLTGAEENLRLLSARQSRLREPLEDDRRSRDR